VVASQGEDKSFFPELNQLRMLKPDGYVAIKPASKTDSTQPASNIKRSFFEMLEPELKEPYSTIKSRQKIAGFLSKEQLIKDLDQIPEESIVLVWGANHVIRIARKGEKWLVYDPNYDHTQLTTMHKIFSKEDCVDEILNRLTNQITLEVASFDENVVIDFPEYKKILETCPAIFIKPRQK
jgi:hypothetical protein